MHKIRQLSLFTITTLISGVILIIYGYFSRFFSVYYFWESLTIGWVIIFVGFILFLLNILNYSYSDLKINKLKRILIKFGISILIFVLCIQMALMIILNLSDAKKVANDFIVKNDKLEKELGHINEVGIITMGSINIHNNNGVYNGSAILHIIVKGENKFKDIKIYLNKSSYDSSWKVVNFK